ncbi:MAG: RagB/SusD family nutrient uptake outer membrane protein [Pedobacter sp.]|nr:MAG: RagB/SusD family nutrient uptake outer membrane protein [Pedobacter sp.]
MKKIIYSVGVFALLVLGTSCNKWLDLEPRDGITKQEFWKTKEDVLAAVSGCYASLISPPPGNTDKSLVEYMFIFGELRADMISPGPSVTNEELAIINVNTTPDNSLTRWAGFYRTINYCNTVIQEAPAVKTTDPTFTDAALNAYTAEALTLRSLMYFYLVRTFGEVPLKLTATTKDTDIISMAKSTKEEILNQIVADLKKAEQGAVTTYGNTRNDKGRVTKFTVNTILADVYLWMEKYPESLAECEKVIGSQRFSYVGANSNWFNAVFYRGSSVETIFEFDQAVSNPFYNLLVRSQRRYIASPTLVSDVFVPDDVDPDNIYDIRAPSFFNSSFTIEKYGIENPSFVKWQAYRYSDIQLIKAEALALTGSGAEAIAIVDDLRAIRNAVDPKPKPVIDPSDQEGICDYILAERSREFAFEGKRWFDLLRHAKRNGYKRIDILLDMISRTVPPTVQQSAITKLRDPNSHYLPIHQDEIFADPKLIQNKFYTK